VIAGYESLEHVLAYLGGLEHERPRNETHAAEIKKQRKIFEAERDRLLAIETERLEAEHKARLEAAGIGVKRT
jgi:hypothetical protein